jgi:hypothetical protein
MGNRIRQSNVQGASTKVIAGMSASQHDALCAKLPFPVKQNSVLFGRVILNQEQSGYSSHSESSPIQKTNILELELQGMVKALLQITLN